MRVIERIVVFGKMKGMRQVSQEHVTLILEAI